MTLILWAIVIAGALSIVYGIVTTRGLMAADAGSARMQEISAAVREGAPALPSPPSRAASACATSLAGRLLMARKWTVRRSAGGAMSKRAIHSRIERKRSGLFVTTRIELRRGMGTSSTWVPTTPCSPPSNPKLR